MLPFQYPTLLRVHFSDEPTVIFTDLWHKKVLMYPHFWFAKSLLIWIHYLDCTAELKPKTDQDYSWGCSSPQFQADQAQELEQRADSLLLQYLSDLLDEDKSTAKEPSQHEDKRKAGKTSGGIWENKGKQRRAKWVTLIGRWEMGLKKETGSSKLKGNSKHAWERHPEWLCKDTWPSIEARVSRNDTTICMEVLGQKSVWTLG